MAYCSSYFLYQRYEKRGDQDWIPSYPNVYSIDGDGSKPLRARIVYDYDCGYIPDTDVEYRDISGTPYCNGYDRYVDVAHQESYDSGISWTTTSTTNVLIESGSSDCGYIEPIYRWVDITPISGDSSTYICDDCPELKYTARYSDSHTETAECDSTSAVTLADGITRTNLASLEIGNCVTSIGGWAFNYCDNLASVIISDSVTEIGERTFQVCSGLTSVTMGSNLTQIGQYSFYKCSAMTSIKIPSSITNIDYAAFSGCTSLTSITVNAITPPTLGAVAFDNTNNCPIYVPAESVNTYKTAYRWSDYASRIQAIS